MERTMILISGIPGAGKTRFGEWLAARMNLVFLCKDRLKERAWDILTNESIRQACAALAYDMCWHFCEVLMQTGQSFIFESNFVEPASEYLIPLVQKHGYRTVQVRFGGDIAIIHKRFLARDDTKERHPGLRSHGRFWDLSVFERAARNCNNFTFGEKTIDVDATYFEQVNYEAIVCEIQAIQ